MIVVKIPTPAPRWLIDKCGIAPERAAKEPRVAAGAINADLAEQRAVDWLAQHAPLAVQDAGGDSTAFIVAAKVKDFGVSEARALDVLWPWNERCSPPWPAEELSEKIANAYRYGTEPVGVAAPEAAFDAIAAPADPAGAAADGGSYLAKLNARYAIVFEEGGHSILHETVDEKGRARRVFMSEASLRRQFSPYLVQQEKGKPLSQAEVWLDWKGRREYTGICFKPERQAANGYYNTWRGFTCEALPPEKATAEQREGLAMWIEHLEQNVCGGDRLLARWLTGYFAHLIQRPWERPLTTIVFRGGKGVGKNALVDRVGRLLGSGHYLVAHDGRYLTSNFNGHMDSCLCLVLDEAFWSGDKGAEGKLKGLTTAPEILIERKGKEAYPVDNLLRLVVIGNEKWLVPASHDERRYAVFDVGDARKQDAKFFERMRVLLDERDGCRLLLWYLRQFDLSAVNVNVAPATKGLLEQKHASLDPLPRWWLDCLNEGVIVGGDFGGVWPETIETARLREAFKRYCREENIRSRVLDSRSFGRELKQIAGLSRKRLRSGQELAWAYALPTLETARDLWQTFIGHRVDWGG